MTSCIFRRQAKQVRSSKLANDFQVDTSATLDPEFAKTHGLKLSKGVIYETSATPQPDGKRRAGDGVVPYQSLAHVSSWAATGSCKVRTKEIPGAEHRAILNNPDLHAALLDFLVTLPPEPLPDAIPCVEAVPLS
ncbi:Hypothetical Protein FCC1311_081171 [Hondaea fermentalgiana]|uniref:Uncharacterized protein n=1 Tax=Hondaea fermentalgiana TaxID=2315210 RepID=A0A2R5GY05_9STRA|nr:Hypothetical Protein FCC1311_081171 [Hondaea fermentalgiana]|eukprot:GBG33321.1 Hypothetical Protein FCC1311_081171 [Hondaea fermentalgiana]